MWQMQKKKTKQKGRASPKKDAQMDDKGRLAKRRHLTFQLIIADAQMHFELQDKYPCSALN